MVQPASNVYKCPHCNYLFLFPPKEQIWNCPVCGKEIEQIKEKDNGKKE